MMSLAAIRAQSREAAAEASRDNRKPFLVEAEDLEDWKAAVNQGTYPKLPFPNLGDYRPKGFVAGEDIFVDSTGCGLESEPAMTIRSLILRRLQVGKFYAITECGEMQLYITEFTAAPKTARRGKVIA